jgi:putative ABC transport system permease protein
MQHSSPGHGVRGAEAQLCARRHSLGIIIGVAAVIVMMALGDGARQSITSRIQSPGTNVDARRVNRAGGVQMGGGATTTLTAADAAATGGGAECGRRQLNTRQQVGRARQLADAVQAPEALPDVRLAGGVRGLLRRLVVARADKVAGHRAGRPDQLFGVSTDPTGQIRIANQPFRVIG